MDLHGSLCTSRSYLAPAFLRRVRGCLYANVIELTFRYVACYFFYFCRRCIASFLCLPCAGAVATLTMI